MTNMTTKTAINSQISTKPVAFANRIAKGIICLCLGSAIIYSVGLSDMAIAHNAAHDTRHAIGFPCH